MCCAFLFFLSAQQTSPPIFTAYGLVSGESTGVRSCCSLSLLSAVLSDFAALPLVPALGAKTRMGNGEEEELGEGNRPEP